MVLDKIENAPLYYSLGDRFRRALEWMAHVDHNSLTPSQRVDIDGDNIYATLFTVDTLPAHEAKLETHRQYADIQYVLEGGEKVGYMLEGGEVRQLSEYEPDIQFFTGDWDTLTVRAGMFYIVWPQDYHAPRLACGSVAPTKRLVVKVKL